MVKRSLLTGQEDCVTFCMTCKKPFYSVSFVWNILRRYLPVQVTDGIRGMRCFKDNTGAVFDVPGNELSRVEDIFEHIQNGKQELDFHVERATELPELKETDGGYGGGGGHYDNRGARNMNNHNYPPRGGYGGGYHSSGPQGSNYALRSHSNGPHGGGGPGMGMGRPNRDQSLSCFIGNLGDVDQRTASGMLQAMGLYPTSVRVLTDDQGKSKGAAFVDFKDQRDFEMALKCNGQCPPGGNRSLRINPAGQKPGGR